LAATVLLPGLAVGSAALAQPSPRQTLNLLVAFQPGTVPYRTASLLARHLGHHLPGRPALSVVANAGFGGRDLAAAMATGRYGTRTPALLNPALLLDPVVGPQRARIELAAFHWIGAATSDVDVVWGWTGRAPATLDDLKRRPMIVGATRQSSALALIPKLMTAALDTRLRVVSGYSGGSERDDVSGGGDGTTGAAVRTSPGGSYFELARAIEGGEVDGFAGMSWRQVRRLSDWVAKGHVTVLVQVGLARDEDLPAVPLATELAGDAFAREAFELMGLVPGLDGPVALPPGAAAADVAEMRAAFDATMADILFQSDMIAAGLEVRPTPGPQVQALTERAREIIAAHGERLRALLRER
jgi:tripartite-type tricarboxylate transporter receptor subunit TctC